MCRKHLNSWTYSLPIHVICGTVISCLLSYVLLLHVPSPPLLPVLSLDPLFLSSFFFQSLSRDHPLQAFHHLPKIFHFSHQPRHLCTPLAREHTSAPPHLGPGDGAPRAVELYPAATVSADQMPVGFPPCCHDRVDQSSCLSVVLVTWYFPWGNVLKFPF